MAHTLEQRPMGALGRMTVVAGLHLAAFYFIARGLGIAPEFGPLVTEPVTPIDQPRPEERIPDVPVIIEDSRPYVPTPEVPIEIPIEPSIISEPLPPGPLLTLPPQGGTADPGIPGTNAMQDARYPLSQPAYPPASKRDNEQGAGIIEVYVLPNGRVGDVRIASTTGFERLDRAAILEAKQSWRFKPATRAGEAVAQWYKVRVVFKLTDQR